MAISRILGSSWARTLMLALLVAAACSITALHPVSVRSDETWWHLSSGTWILQHHAIPRNAFFSQRADLPWVDSTWLFDLILASAYKLIALRALLAIEMLLRAGVALSMYLLAGGMRRFWPAIVLSTAVLLATAELSPITLYISTIALALELHCLMAWRRTGDARTLYWLPPLFLLWCNLHLQFAMGLAILSAFLVEEAVRWLLQPRQPGMGKSQARASALLWTEIACVLATILNPYGIRLLSQVYRAAYSSTAFANFAEMRALAFRSAGDFVLLVLAMGAFVALGRARARDWALICLLVATLCLTFRIQRETWLLATICVAVYAEALSGREESPTLETPPAHAQWETWATAIACIAVVAVSILRLPSSGTILANASRFLPVKACDYVKTEKLPAPLFNSLQWGGFISWYLPDYPTVVDGRTEIYGDDYYDEYFSTVRGNRRLQEAPLFVKAQTIVVVKDSPIEHALISFPDLAGMFNEPYSDRQSAVIIRK